MLGGARRCSEVLGGARRCLEVLAGARRCSEVLGGARRCSQQLLLITQYPLTYRLALKGGVQCYFSSLGNGGGGRIERFKIMTQIF